MTKAIRIHQHGGPAVLKWEDVEMGTPADQEVLVRHTAIGVNLESCQTLGSRVLLP